jgi:redox-sensitive bicupin YhaK (pirin superfamily)
MSIPENAQMGSFGSIDRRPVRQIARRTRGQSHGPITRLMSPSDFGQLLKPFVFLDLFDNNGIPFEGFGLHPHSGIGTLTYLLEGSTAYEARTAPGACCWPAA